MLIQIVDPDREYPVPMHEFSEVHQFKFLDIEEKEPCDIDSWRCSNEQAEQIVACLRRALTDNQNVVVHCHMGMCRSGAVAEVGVQMGFEDLEVLRVPNITVKHKLMRVLGWTYDHEEPSDWRDKVQQYYSQKF